MAVVHRLERARLGVTFHQQRNVCQAQRAIMRSMHVLKFIVEKHSDGYLAYPLVLRGVVVGQGDSYETALADARSAAQFHIDTFGDEAWEDDGDVEAAYVAEASVAAG